MTQAYCAKWGTSLMDSFFPSHCCFFQCSRSYLTGIVSLSTVGDKDSQVSSRKECGDHWYPDYNKILQTCIFTKGFRCRFPGFFNALPDKRGFSTAHLAVCVTHWWVTHRPICASPQSIRAGIAPSYRAWLTVQPHSSRFQASGSHACPASQLSSFHTCAY